MAQRNCMTWRGNCRVCGKMRRNGSGVFCVNFWMSREGFLPCANVWCGKCYMVGEHNPFSIQETLEEYLDLELDPREEGLYR